MEHTVYTFCWLVKDRIRFQPQWRVFNLHQGNLHRNLRTFTLSTPHIGRESDSQTPINDITRPVEEERRQEDRYDGFWEIWSVTCIGQANWEANWFPIKQTSCPCFTAFSFRMNEMGSDAYGHALPPPRKVILDSYYCCESPAHSCPVGAYIFEKIPGVLIFSTVLSWAWRPVHLSGLNSAASGPQRAVERFAAPNPI